MQSHPCALSIIKHSVEEPGTGGWTEIFEAWYVNTKRLEEQKRHLLCYTGMYKEAEMLLKGPQK